VNSTATLHAGHILCLGIRVGASAGSLLCCFQQSLNCGESIMITGRMRTALILGLTTASVLGALPLLIESRKRSGLPLPGWRKRDPEEREKMLDRALQDSMIASDPLSITQPDVKL